MADKERGPAEVGLAEISVAYKQVFATQEGQIVLQDLLRRFGYNRHSLFDKDAMLMASREGARAVLIHMGNMIDADPAGLDERKGEL